MIHQTDMLAPEAARLYYQTKEYQPELEQLLAEVRQKLDSGLGEKLFKKYRAKQPEPGDFFDAKYCLIIIGALLMRSGAKIKDEHLRILRDLVPQIHCSNVYALPLFDEGFRGPGKVQFLAALDHYTPGVPRNFQEPRYDFHCPRLFSFIPNSLNFLFFLITFV
jgi:hypothetical protein